MDKNEPDPELIETMLREVEAYTAQAAPIGTFSFNPDTLHMLDLAMRLAYCQFAFYYYEPKDKLYQECMVLAERVFDHFKYCDMRDMQLTFMAGITETIDKMFHDDVAQTYTPLVEEGYDEEEDLSEDDV